MGSNLRRVQVMNKQQYLPASRVGVVGSGFIAKGLVMALEGQPEAFVAAVTSFIKSNGNRAV